MRNFVLILFGLLAAASVVGIVTYPMSPGVAARVAPPGLEREALVASTGLAYGQLMAGMHGASVLGMALLGLGGMLIVAAVAVSLARSLGHFEREVHHYHDLSSPPPAVPTDPPSHYGRLGQRGEPARGPLRDLILNLHEDEH